MIALTVLTLGGCSGPDPFPGPPVDPTSEPDSGTDTGTDSGTDTATPTGDTGTPILPSALDLELDAAYRIALEAIDVTFEIDATATDIIGRAELTFTMRPDQRRALFHFDPWAVGTVRDQLVHLELDGEALDPADEADLTVLLGPDQLAFEVQRDLDPIATHTLVVEYTLIYPHPGWQLGWFQTAVDDTVGLGNQGLWPTLNAPGELAVHTIQVRIDDPREFVMLGSGRITSQVEGTTQVFDLDTERAVSSYTVMFAAMPEDDVEVVRFDADGVPVTIASILPTPLIEASKTIAIDKITQLQADFGPFPSPEMHILLLDWADGMEYYGATTTGPTSLEHELAHMYFGCSAVNRTWRDTWMDEALAVWWESDGSVPDLPNGYASDMVSGRTATEIGFDLRGYGFGAMMMGEVADALGGVPQMTSFLADLHARRAFMPYTTETFVDDVVDATGDPTLRDDFDRWVFGAP